CAIRTHRAQQGLCTRRGLDGRRVGDVCSRARRGFAALRELRCFAAPFKALSEEGLLPESTRRLAQWSLGLLCVAVGLLAPASAGAITSAQCAVRVNDTPSKLVECIQQGDLSAHMDNLQAIANANPGPDGHPSRNSGEPGYKASADYVAQVMTDAGYDVQ